MDVVGVGVGVEVEVEVEVELDVVVAASAVAMTAALPRRFPASAEMSSEIESDGIVSEGILGIAAVVVGSGSDPIDIEA